ncbi:MFS transporter [Rhizobium leguminosarum]|uniref:MFS transporter n=1 Tax=Rhizobium leguminosarum TaxID=384 RepID=UPI00143F7E9E|nr:MFS transporter [Rhizobium leguminosarum]NKL23701.1 DHA2 family efflux MFS transporter permease subunit [Rhizobium leguminosarum bv. viciae]
MDSTTDGSPTASERHKWVLPVTILGSSLGFIDSSVVNIALPTIQSDFGVGLAAVQWISNGYLLTLASFILLGGALGDRFGTLKAFVVGLTVFVGASVACGLASSHGFLIAARMMQGAGGAVLVPTSLALISQAYTGEARGKAIGTWAGAGGVLMALGPPLGGWMVDHVGWRSIFFINVPIGALALLLSRNIRESQKGDHSRHLDIPGSILAVIALGLFTYALIQIGEGDIQGGMSILVVSLLIGGLFIFIESRSRHPILPLRLFSDRNFTGSNILTVVLYGGLGGALFMLPFHLIKAHEYSTTMAGAAFLPFSVILGVGSRSAGGISSKTGPRLPMVAGPVLTGIGFAALGFSSALDSYWIGYFPGLVLIGVGMTITIPVLTTIVFDSAPKEDSGSASGINNAAARSGGLIAVASLGIAFGTSDMNLLSPADISNAYAVIMTAASASAFLSALLAWLVIKEAQADAND